MAWAGNFMILLLAINVMGGSVVAPALATFKLSSKKQKKPNFQLHRD